MGFDGNYLLSHLFGGGLMLGAWFMATDYVTTPITPNGQLIYGCCLGILTAIFRLFGGSAEGVSYAIIFCNLLVPIIEKVTKPVAFGKGGKKHEYNLKNTISITVITLVAGLALGVVQDITAGPIATQAEKSKEEAYKAVFEDASSFSEYSLDDTNQAEDLVAYLNDNGFTAQTIDEIMVAEDASGETLGYAFTVTDSEGYGGDIQFAMGVQNDGTLNGISILSISETAGLGMKATTDSFKDQFKNKNVEKFTYTKTGSTSDDQIDAISGATITTNAMTNGVNAGLCAFRYVEGGAES